MELIKLDQIKPASYNPRQISESGFENLKASLKCLGVVKPIIVHAENNVIVAGHQRTKAMQAVGITECMAFVIKGINQQDECRFNQLHNRCEYELSDEAPKIQVTRKLQLGYNRISFKDLKLIDKGSMASINLELSRLLARYGEFGCPICDARGNIVISSAYALASLNTRHDLYVLVLEDDKIELAKYYFSKDYGRFCYDGIERKTYIQALAQMKRLRQGKGKMLHSRLYEGLVLPFISKPQNKAKRILDFGAGEYDYAKMLMAQGYDIHMVDPYHREKGLLSVAKNTASFLKICSDLDKFGRYDIVICDSVLNSIDNIQSWYDVINTCYVLLKPNGHMFISGRPMVAIIDAGRCRHKIVSKKDTMYFTDNNNLTANFREGQWFFQKFDTKQDLDVIVAIFGSKIDMYSHNTSYGLHLQKTNSDYDFGKCVESAMREFNMMLPNGKSYGLQEQIKVSLTKLKI